VAVDHDRVAAGCDVRQGYAEGGAGPLALGVWSALIVAPLVGPLTTLPSGVPWVLTLREVVIGALAAVVTTAVRLAVPWLSTTAVVQVAAGVVCASRHGRPRTCQARWRCRPLS